MGTPKYGDKTKTPKKPGSKSPGGSWGKYGSGGGSGSASGDAKAKKQAMQSYLYVIYNLYGKKGFSSEQQQLAEQAYKLKWSASSYAVMLRRQDPMYIHSDDYKTRAAAAKDLYQQFRPGRVVPHDFINSYARSGMSNLQAQQKLEKTGWFKREFAGWDEAQRAGSSAGNSPQTFINYRTMWNNALRNAYGQEATPLEQRAMFGSGMTGDEVAKNFADLLGGAESLKWATGAALNRAQNIQGALTAKYGKAALNAVQGARQTQAGYLGSKSKSFDLGVDDLTGNLAASRI